MSKNSGKVFEDDFRKSVPDYCFLHRLKDTAQSYNKSKKFHLFMTNQVKISNRVKNYEL